MISLLSELSDAELATLNEAVDREGERRGWDSFWQDCGPHVDFSARDIELVEFRVEVVDPR